MMYLDFISDYKNLTLTPHIDIYRSEDTKERNAKICIYISWLFWELYIDIV